MINFKFLSKNKTLILLLCFVLIACNTVIYRPRNELFLLFENSSSQNSVLVIYVNSEPTDTIRIKRFSDQTVQESNLKTFEFQDSITILIYDSVSKSSFGSVFFREDNGKCIYTLAEDEFEGLDVNYKYILRYATHFFVFKKVPIYL